MPSNPRLTKREIGLLKGSLRRVFSRSELRRQIIETAVIPGYSDPSRPRVKTWCRCAVCKKPEAKSNVVADHISPVIPLDRSFGEMSLDETLDRMWCEPSNLQPICPACHKDKSKLETKQRKEFKKEKRQK